mgnify:FL=1
MFTVEKFEKEHKEAAMTTGTWKGSVPYTIYNMADVDGLLMTDSFMVTASGLPNEFREGDRYELIAKVSAKKDDETFYVRYTAYYGSRIGVEVEEEQVGVLVEPVTKEIVEYREVGEVHPDTYVWVVKDYYTGVFYGVFHERWAADSESEDIAGATSVQRVRVQ